MLSNDQVEQYREELPGDEEIEATFQRLRSDGHSRLDALQFILDTLDISLLEAKRILQTNNTWDEARASTEPGPDAAQTDGSANSVPPAPG